MRIREAIACGTLLFLAGCTVHSAKSTLFDGRDRVGIAYSPLKTILSVELTLVYADGVAVENGVEVIVPPKAITLNGDVVVTAYTIPDSSVTFLLKSDDLWRDAFLRTNSNYAFGGGTISGVDSFSVDTTTEAVQQLASAAIGIAKAITRSTEKLPPREAAIQALQSRMNQIYTEIAQAQDKPDRGAVVQGLMRELDETAKNIKELEAMRIQPHVNIGKAKVYVDPNQPTGRTEDFLEYTLNPVCPFANVPPETMPQLKLRIYDRKLRENLEALPQVASNQAVPGIVYRQPTYLKTTILTQNDVGDFVELSCARDPHLPYLQFAPPVVAAIDSKPLTDRRTVIRLDPVSGGMMLYIVEADSSADKLAAAFNVTAHQAQGPSNDDYGSGGSGGRGGSRGGSHGSNVLDDITNQWGPPAPTSGPATNVGPNPGTRPTTGPGGRGGRGGRGGSGTQPASGSSQ